jgi:hypothetical protein
MDENIESILIAKNPTNICILLQKEHLETLRKPFVIIILLFKIIF